LKKIPKKIKYIVFGISLIIFSLLHFGVINLFEIGGFLQNIEKHYFINYLNNFDFLIIASIPAFGMLLYSKRNKFRISKLILDIFTILFCVIVTFGVGLYILTIIGKKSSPFIPDHFINEPFLLYSTLTIGIGVLLQVLLLKQTKELNEINDIGIKK
jgi:tellurite resistance protein TehA-like permease